MWLERALIAADDRRLLDSPLGLAGHRVLATMWWAGGEALAPARRQALLDSARDVLAAEPLARAPPVPPRRSRAVVVVRLLAAGVEPAMQCLMAVRAAWRQAGLGPGGRAAAHLAHVARAGRRAARRPGAAPPR